MNECFTEPLHGLWCDSHAEAMHASLTLRDLSLLGILLKLTF